MASLKGRVTRRFEKIHPNFQKVAQTDSEPKKAIKSTTKLTLKAPKTYIKPLLKPKNTHSKPYLKSADLGENIIN
jgi:hypothetical protein